MRFLLPLLGLLPLVLGLGQNATITLKKDSKLLQLAGNGNGQIIVSSNDWWGVIRTAEDLAGDFGKVTGKNLTLAKSKKGQAETIYYEYREPTSDTNYTVGPVQKFTGPTLKDYSKAKTIIIAGTIGKSDIIDELIKSKKIDITQIKGRWESFISEVVKSPIPGVDRALVIAGSDERGTIFGLYDISEQIGVSPWYWFADVPIRKAEGVWALDTKKVQGPPSVKYRGIFINDEQPGLTNWINANYKPGKYGAGFNHYFYPRVFELLLRLRANYLWPAMWGSMFNVDDYANQPLADAYAIVMGSSHTEPMMRATNEWGTFGKSYGGSGVWAFDTNNASISPFFKYGAQRAEPYAKSSLVTMAMRGYHDTAIELTDEYAIKLLEIVVAEQRKILTDVFNGTKITDIPQMWCLYKEVQGYYESGMQVPDDITLLWADDNWGNLRRLPIGNETTRSGGAGVYYHFDYVGDPRSYKWINTIQLEKTLEQMKLAYERKADRIWIVNVGDLKAQEIPINHFLDLAYDTPKWGYDSVPTWLKLWAAREFGLEQADKISSVVDRYGMYAARRKYELLDPSTYSVLNYNEATTVLEQWKTLGKDAQAIYDKLDENTKVSFYQTVLQPVLGGGVVTAIHIGVAQNAVYGKQKRNSANTVAQNVLKLFKEDATLTKRYHDLLGGKWNHILDQPHLGYEYWQQPMRNQIPPLTFVQDLETSVAGNIGVAIEGSNATISGDDNYHANSGNTLVLPPMDPYGPKSRWVDIFARGTDGCQWTLSPWSNYVKVSPSTGYTGGNNGTDTRVLVSIDWKTAPTAPNISVININITTSCNGWGNYPSPRLQIPVNNTLIPTTFTTGFVESNKVISIEAEHASRNTSSGNTHYQTLPGHGRTLSGVTLFPVLAPTQELAKGPVLEYDIFTFTSTSVANVTLYLSPSLNQNGPTRNLAYAIAIDAATPIRREFVPKATGGNLPLGWDKAVSDSVWRGNTTTTTHDLSVKGKHTLKVWLLEPGVVVQKIVVDFGGLLPSYLGPPESFRVGRDTVGAYDGTKFA